MEADTPLTHNLEALLFYLAEPTPKAKLATFLGISDDELHQALPALRERFSNGGIALIEDDGALALRTAPSVAPLIESVRKHELSRDIGRAGAETLAIVLYKGPVTRAEIDHIRGVNSSYILRTLQVRGLVERLDACSGARMHYYRATQELLAHLGVARIEDLPDHHELQDKLARALERSEDEGGE